MRNKLTKTAILVSVSLIYLHSVACAEYRYFSLSLSDSERSNYELAMKVFRKWPEVREAYYLSRNSGFVQISLKSGTSITPMKIMMTFEKYECHGNELSFGAFGKIISFSGKLMLRLSGFKNNKDIPILKVPAHDQRPSENSFVKVNGVIHISDEQISIDIEDWYEIPDLESAAWYGDLYQVRERIRNGEDVNSIHVYGKTALMEVRDEEVANALIQAGAKLNTKNNAGQTALMKAASNNNLEVARVLISAGANLNLRDEDGCTALMIAASLGHVEIIQALIDGGANVNVLNEFGVSALEFAAWNGYGDIVEMLRHAGAKGYTKEIQLVLAINNANYDRVSDLVRSGADINIKDSNNTTLLILAAFRNSSAGSFINRTININARNDRGCTALASAILSEKTQIVKGLLEAGADPNLPGCDDTTPIEIAIERGNPFILQILLETGADPVSHRGRCQSPIQMAIQSKSDPSIIRILKEHGAKEPGELERSLLLAAATCSMTDIKDLISQKIDLEFRGDQCRSAMIFAAEAGCIEAVKILFEAGADVNATFYPPAHIAFFTDENIHALTVSKINGMVGYGVGGNPSTALDVALDSKKEDLVEFLIKAGAISISQESTPLIDSVKSGNASSVRDLIKQGMNVNSSTRNRWTPLMHASQIGNLKIVNELISANADVNKSYKRRRLLITPIMLAAENNHQEVVEVLLENKANPKYLKRSTLIGRIKARDIHGVRKMLQEGVPADAKDTNGDPMVTIAANLGQWSIVRTLLNAGANINSKDTHNMTLLEIAYDKDRIGEMNYLLSAGANPNPTDHYDKTLLARAIEDGNTEAIRVLKSAKAKQ